MPLSFGLTVTPVLVLWKSYEGEGDPSGFLVAGPASISDAACLVSKPGHFSAVPHLPEGQSSHMLRWF